MLAGGARSTLDPRRCLLSLVRAMFVIFSFSATKHSGISRDLLGWLFGEHVYCCTQQTKHPLGARAARSRRDSRAGACSHLPVFRASWVSQHSIFFVPISKNHRALLLSFFWHVRGNERNNRAIHWCSRQRFRGPHHHSRPSPPPPVAFRARLASCVKDCRGAGCSFPTAFKYVDLPFLSKRAPTRLMDKNLPTHDMMIGLATSTSRQWITSIQPPRRTMDEARC